MTSASQASLQDDILDMSFKMGRSDLGHRTHVERDMQKKQQSTMTL